MGKPSQPNTSIRQLQLHPELAPPGVLKWSSPPRVGVMPNRALMEGNEMVIGNIAFTCGTSTSSSSCETNILKEEEARDQCRQNDKSTSPRSSTLYATSHVGLMAKKEKNVASESESENESDDESDDDDDVDQCFAHLSKKDKLIMLKFIEKIEEQEEFLIKNIKCLEELTKEHQKLKCAHASLVKSQPSVEHVLVETCDDSITKENEELKEEVERLRRDLIQMKGKCNAQPSQYNYEYMAKKLGKGSTDAGIKPYQESHKANNRKIKEQRRMMNKTPITCPKCNKEGHHVKDCSLKKEEKNMSKIQEKKKAHVKCSNMGYNASKCSNKVDDQATLPKKKTTISKRKCYGCYEKGHEIDSCPNKKSDGLMSSRKRLIDKEASKRQEEKTSHKNKHRLCYACQREGHKFIECPNKDNISSRPTQVQVSKKIQYE
ncbi:uncharacterized protein [Miscanthus floridulus]|uniref:uncharacterized protein n=1 Tax=Miscanthus floridulus TaxID=154761 RepID=UPI003459A34E